MSTCLRGKIEINSKELFNEIITQIEKDPRKVKYYDCGERYFEIIVEGNKTNGSWSDIVQAALTLDNPSNMKNYIGRVNVIGRQSAEHLVEVDPCWHQIDIAVKNIFGYTDLPCSIPQKYDLAFLVAGIKRGNCGDLQSLLKLVIEKYPGAVDELSNLEVSSLIRSYPLQDNYIKFYDAVIYICKELEQRVIRKTPSANEAYKGLLQLVAKEDNLALMSLMSIGDAKLYDSFIKIIKKRPKFRNWLAYRLRAFDKQKIKDPVFFRFLFNYYRQSAVVHERLQASEWLLFAAEKLNDPLSKNIVTLRSHP